MKLYLLPFIDFFERRGTINHEIYWPNEEVIQKIEALGCHVVPKPSKKELTTFQHGESLYCKLKK